jgi:hypothetical protein
MPSNWNSSQNLAKFEKKFSLEIYWFFLQEKGMYDNFFPLHLCEISHTKKDMCKIFLYNFDLLGKFDWCTIGKHYCKKN